jgi:hypothetical protein
VARTRLSWKADTDISGTIASVGARLMEGTAKKLTEQFWTKFALSLAAAGPAPDGAAPAAAAESATPAPPPAPAGLEGAPPPPQPPTAT